MPIVFAPPSPAGNYPGLSIEAGKGQALMHDLPTLVRAMEAGQQAAQANASRATQAQIASAGLQQRDREFQQSQMMQSALADAHNQQQAEMQGAAMDQQAAMQQARLNQQMQMFLLEPTQQEMIRRAQLKGALGKLDDAVRNGEVTPEQAAESRAKTFGYLGPIEEKFAKFKLMQMDEQVQQAQSRNKLMADMETQRQNFLLGNFDQLPLVTDPNTGKKVRMMMNHNGEWYDPFAKSAKPAGPAKLPPGVMTEAQYTKDLDRATHMTDADLEKGRTTDWGATYERNRVRVGLPPKGNYAEYLQSRGFTQDAEGNIHPYQAPPSSAQRSGVMEDMTHRAAAQGDISQADKPVGGMAPAPTPVGQPFNLNDPNLGEKLTPTQKGLMQSYDGSERFLADPRLTPQERQDGQVFVGTMRALLSQYGDIRHLQQQNPGAYAQYREAEKRFDMIYNAASKRPAPAAIDPTLQSAQEGFQRLRFK